MTNEQFMRLLRYRDPALVRVLAEAHLLAAAHGDPERGAKIAELLRAVARALRPTEE